jgi:hypothetical protein
VSAFGILTEAEYLRPRADHGTAILRTAGEGLAQQVSVDRSRVWDVDGRGDVVAAHVGDEALDLVRVDHSGVDAELALLLGRRAEQAFVARIQAHPDVPRPPHPDVRLQLLEDLEAHRAELRVQRILPQARHVADRHPGGAARQVLAFEHGDVTDTELRQPPRRGEPGDAAADDDDRWIATAAHRMITPPLMSMVAPVMNEAASDAR